MFVRSRTIRRFMILPVSASMLAGAVLLASAAGAHVGTFDATCYVVSYQFTEFPEAPGNVVSVQAELGPAIVTRDVTWNGPATSGTIPFDATSGGVVHVEAVWDTNGVSGSETADVVVAACVEVSTTTTAATTTTTAATTTTTAATTTTTTAGLSAPAAVSTSVPTTAPATAPPTTTTTVAFVSQGAAAAPPPAASPGAGLAFTGGAVRSELVLALGLLALGGLALGFSISAVERRR